MAEQDKVAESLVTGTQPVYWGALAPRHGPHEVGPRSSTATTVPHGSFTQLHPQSLGYGTG
jgi:hypothetical protein